jgi:hypothetical protein
MRNATVRMMTVMQAWTNMCRIAALELHPGGAVLAMMELRRAATVNGRIA